MQKVLLFTKETVYEKVAVVLNNNKIIIFHVMLFGDFFFHFKYIELINSEQFSKGNDQTILKP